MLGVQKLGNDCIKSQTLIGVVSRDNLKKCSMKCAGKSFHGTFGRF